jgi:outer membrane biosynthesis protein TonB
MKLIHAILAAGVASVLPTASADERAQPKPFTIAFSSEIAPVSHAEIRYPAYAGVRSLSGSCQVSFAISTGGEPDAIRVGECSSEVFRAAAKSTVQSMTFAPRASVVDKVRMEIRWTLEDPTLIRTASLN